jgi:hypothetical protein
VISRLAERMRDLILLLVVALSLASSPGCVVAFRTPRYPGEWGPKPEGRADECPALSGTYVDKGEPAPYCTWVFPLPIPFGCSWKWEELARVESPYETGDQEQGELQPTTYVRIEMEDGETMRIATLSNEHEVIRTRVLSRASGDFSCRDGLLSYSFAHQSGDYNFSGTRALGRSSDGSLLIRHIQHVDFGSEAGGGYTYTRLWSRHSESVCPMHSPPQPTPESND